MKYYYAKIPKHDPQTNTIVPGEFVEQMTPIYEKSFKIVEIREGKEIEILFEFTEEEVRNSAAG